MLRIPVLSACDISCKSGVASTAVLHSQIPWYRHCYCPITLQHASDPKHFPPVKRAHSAWPDTGHVGRLRHASQAMVNLAYAKRCDVGVSNQSDQTDNHPVFLAVLRRNLWFEQWPLLKQRSPIGHRLSITTKERRCSPIAIVGVHISSLRYLLCRTCMQDSPFQNIRLYRDHRSIPPPLLPLLYADNILPPVAITL